MMVLSKKTFAQPSFFAKVKRLSLPLLCGMLLATHALAVPQVLPISGVLTDANGRGLDETVTLHLRLYDALSAGSVVYEEEQNVVVENGHFAAYMGQQSALDLNVFDSDDLYLGIQVEGDDELSPRFPLGLVPFAARAAFADEAASLEGNVAADFASASHGHVLADLPAELADGDDDTVYSAASPIVLNGTVIGLTDQCVPGQVLKAFGSGWNCADDENGTFTAVTPLIKNGDTVALMGCTAGQVLKSNGSAWSCASDDVGGTGGAVLTAGAGLLDSANTWAVDESVFQRRLNPCGPGEAIRSSAEDGSVVCVDVGTSFSAGSGLSLMGSTFSVDTASTQARVDGTCAAGFAVRSVNVDGTVVCESVAGSSIIAGTGLTLAGSTMSADPSVVQNRVSGTCGAGFAVSGVGQDGSVTCRSVGAAAGGYAVSTNLRPLLDETSWTALTFTATDSFDADDEGVVGITLPFAFSVFGTSSTNVVLSSNGVLYFDSLEADFSGVTDFTNSTLPSSKSSQPFLAAFWDDLDLAVARTRVLGTGNQRTFVIDVNATRVFCSPCELGYSISLHEGDGRIDVHYQDLADETSARPQGSSATFGLQSAGGVAAQAALLGYNETMLRLTTEEQFVTYAKP